MKLLALYIDCTLVNSQHQVTTPVRNVLLEAQRTRNVRIILASGDQPQPYDNSYSFSS